MQTKYLSLALATVLATTLSACGSDDDSNNNSDVVTDSGTPAPAPTPTPTYDPATTDTDQDGKMDAVDDDIDGDGVLNAVDADPLDPAVVTPPVVVVDPVTNPGDAAYDGKATDEPSTVGQQYRRGVKSEYDRSKNASEEGNTGVLSWKSIQNDGLTNIVFGRETVELQDSSVSVRRYAGQDGSAPDWTNENSLQVWNTEGGVAINNTLKVDGTPVAVANTSAESSNIDITGDFRDESSYTNRADTADNGLVAMTTSGNGALYTITGQEEQVLKLNADGETVDAVVTNGQDAPTRILGHYYNGTEGLTQDGKDTLTAKAAREANSWQYAPNKKGYNSADSALTEKLVANVDLDTKSQIGRLSAVAKNTAADNNVLAANAIKLNHVQYGRVTTNIDPIEGLNTSGITAQSFIYSPYMDKHTYAPSDKVTADDTTVDTYFYRGLGETTLDEMAELAADKEYTYRGHAITYGIDNTFHGATNGGDTNSFTFGKDKVGLGNFVEATFNTATKKVDGSIYNVWLEDSASSDTQTIDTLVSFEGDVVGNTVVNGTSALAYGSKGAGSFKGSFFGTKATELGGSVNAIESGYGEASWGGVFGAQRTSTTTVEPNANQID